jgi:hypothetical protein
MISSYEAGGKCVSFAVPDSTDQKLLGIVVDPKPTTIAEVISRMNDIDAVLPGRDGLKWFNWLYWLVTTEVQSNPPTAGWKHPNWLTRLDVVFADLYFAAVESELSGSGSTPKSWRALFEVRHSDRIDRIQFALAGMNAHINHDLSLALLQTDADFNIAPSRRSPERDDFEAVNGLLERVLPEALSNLAVGDIWGQLAQDTGKIGRLLAMWNVRAARNMAWDFADHLRSLNNISRALALTANDQLTGVLGRALLAV